MVPISFKKLFLLPGNTPFFALWWSKLFLRVIYVLPCFIFCSEQALKILPSIAMLMKSWGLGVCESLNSYRCLYKFFEDSAGLVWVLFVP